MDSGEISKLACILRQNASEVLSGASKLTLSFDLLGDLNTSFNLIIDQRDVMNSSFQVVNNCSAKVEVFRDLLFLHDFVQRAASLKLTPNNNKEYTDVTKFRNLKLLEICKLDVKTIFGIEALKVHLQCIICLRSISNLSEILKKCGGDASSGSAWPELKEAIFRHNSLQSIDGSLEYVHSLHTLDLSHNEIEDGHALSCLPNLKNLNLSYNKLVSIPAFFGQSCNRLQVLALRNNFIEDISEISVLINLFELDLCDNCLIEHNSLVPLANLATLQWLNLAGNPLSYHPQHRNKTSSYLHTNTTTIRFVLDRIVLSKSEKKLVGSLHPRVLRRPTSVPLRSNSGEFSEKPKRIRNAMISDSIYSPAVEVNNASACSLLTSAEHLDTKRQIEQLRHDYGEDWLRQEAGSLVQDVLGLEKMSIPANSTPYGSVDVLIHEEIIPKDCIDMQEAIADEENKANNEQTAETFVTASESTVESTIYTNDVSEEMVEQFPNNDEDLAESEENMYLATIKGAPDDTVIIVITKTHIHERDVSAKELTKWPLESLLHFQDLDGYIQLDFDTLRNDRKQRQYILEDEDYTRFKTAVQVIVENRPPDQFVVYKCMKCSTQFGVEKKKRLHDNSKVTCPSCKGALVFEDDDA